LIDDPTIVSELTGPALKKNLAAHAAVNPDVLAEGSRKEMKARLETLLELRQADLILRDIIWKEDCTDDTRMSEGS